MMRQYPDPRSGTDLARWPFGINAQDDLTIMDSRYAQKMDNFEYRKGTPWRRRPFVAKSTEVFGGQATDALEYVDPTGQARIIWGSTDGVIREWTGAAAHVDRVATLTAGRTASLMQMLGAAFHQNGEDRPLRGDGEDWREAGAPLPAGTLAHGTATAGALTGTFIWMVTACVHDGTDVILESDHSNYLDATLAAERQPLSWGASADPRVNWYRLYRTENGQGTPLFLEAEGDILAYTSNTLDDDLSEQVAAPLGRNGRMPVSRILTQAGGRAVCAGLVDADDPNAGRTVHLSIIATNRFEMEYFPADRVHRFALPGTGDVTAAIGYSVKDEDLAAKDLFLAQAGACYILRGADPYGVLEPISFTKGVIGKKAIVQWRRFLFFVSREGLEFLGPEGDPVLISPHVNAYFLGGGPLNLAGNVGDAYIALEVHESRLLITLRDQDGLQWGNKALVLDLERFNPYNPKAWEEAFYTLWSVNGAGMAFFLALRGGGLLCFDNQNRRLLQRGPAGAKDTANGAQVAIRALLWTSGLMSEFMSVLKVVRQINALFLSEEDISLDLVFDQGAIAVQNKTITRLTQQANWDRTWDRAWADGITFLSTVYLSRTSKGRMCQARIRCENNSRDFVFSGLTLFYSAVKARRMISR